MKVLLVGVVVAAAIVGGVSPGMACVKSDGHTDKDKQLATLICDADTANGFVSVWVGTGEGDPAKDLLKTVTIELKATPKYVLLWTSADKRTGDRKGGKAMVEGLLKVIHAVSPDAVALVQVSMVREGETRPRMSATRKTPTGATEWWYRDDPPAK